MTGKVHKKLNWLDPSDKGNEDALQNAISLANQREFPGRFNIAANAAGIWDA